MGLVEVVGDGVFVAIILLRQVFVNGLSLGDVFDKVPDLNMALILPWICATPMAVKSLLHLFHLFVGSILSVFLHARVKRGIDLQSLGIKGISIVEILLAPVFQVVGYGFAEIVGITVVGTFNTIVKFNVKRLERVAFFLCQVAMLAHQVEYNVTTLQ